MSSCNACVKKKKMIVKRINLPCPCYPRLGHPMPRANGMLSTSFVDERKCKCINDTTVEDSHTLQTLR